MHIRTLRAVVHIGALDPAQKGNRGPSLEGPGLSVSTCPDAWEHIARLGGNPWWQLTRKDSAFLEVHALTEAQRQAIVGWGLKQGLVERVERWTWTRFDDELEHDIESVFPTREAAALEQDDGDGRIDRCTMAVALPALNHYAGQTVDDLNAFDLLAVAYADRVLDIDGVYWADRLDEYALSAPRAVIHARKLAQWTIKPMRPRR